MSKVSIQRGVPASSRCFATALAAASRAVTEAARLRRLQLVDTYIQHLKALKAPSPFSEIELSEAHAAAGAYCHREVA